MSALIVRLALAAVLLVGGWWGERALEQHVLSAGPLPEVSLAKPLAEFPLQLGEWQGTEQPITDPILLYADQHLKRYYVHPRRQQVVSIWMAYSREGTDRGHHPEVCMAVSGRPEDPTERAAIEVPGHAAPIQQYRFGTPGDRQWVYYWHYTLWPPKANKLSDVQLLYQRLHKLPSSVTLEVFAPENSPEDVAYAVEFVKLLDAAIQEHVGPTALRGSRRKQVTRLTGEG
jgi:hypothetical protein